MCRIRPVLTLFALLLMAIAGPVLAREEILSFDSLVEVQPDGDYIVTETIEVRAEGVQIKRGIYRDFPTTLEDADGNIVKTGFELISATRDSAPETTRIDEGARAVRVYLGRSDVYLESGVYTYVLKYRTDRQVRFFTDHDEIYWNATGTEWAFAISRASAVIRLPETAQVLEWIAFTGPYGATGDSYRASVLPSGTEVRFVTNAPLGVREGLTVDVNIAKGAVAGPSSAQSLSWFLRDHLAELIAVAGAALVFLYYLSAWTRVGRDPPEELMVPRWAPPEGVSPALAHYIWNKGLQGNGFPALSAAAINLAVRGYLIFDEFGASLTIRRTEKTAQLVDFPVGEAAVMRRVIREGGSLAVKKTNSIAVSSLGSDFRHAMEREHRSVYYHFNYLPILIGVAASALVVLALLFFGNLSEESLAVIAPVAIVGVAATWVLVSFAKGSSASLVQRLRMLFIRFVILTVAYSVGLDALSNLLPAIGSPYLVGALATLLMTNLLFFYLLGAPTPLGQRRTAELKGLRHYLTVAEEDRMNMAGAPQMSPQHFETLLPHAVALGVEKPWTEAFQNWLATATATGAMASGAYAPGWYHGRIDGGSVVERLDSLGSSMSSSLTSALPTPKSSSSGFSGGGSSGGGGGGGGGGGW